jgi:hypothetical protein
MVDDHGPYQYPDKQTQRKWDPRVPGRRLPGKHHYRSGRSCLVAHYGPDGQLENRFICGRCGQCCRPDEEYEECFPAETPLAVDYNCHYSGEGDVTISWVDNPEDAG